MLLTLAFDLENSILKQRLEKERLKEEILQQEADNLEKKEANLRKRGCVEEEEAYQKQLRRRIQEREFKHEDEDRDEGRSSRDRAIEHAQKMKGIDCSNAHDVELANIDLKKAAVLAEAGFQPT